MFFEILLDFVMLVGCAYGAFIYGRLVVKGNKKHRTASFCSEVETALTTGIKEVRSRRKSETSTERRTDLTIALTRLEKTLKETLPRLRLYMRLAHITGLVASVMNIAFTLFLALRCGHEIGQLKFIPVIQIPYEIYYSFVLLLIVSSFACSKCSSKVLQKGEEIDDALDHAGDTLVDASMFIQLLHVLLVRRDNDVRAVH